MSIPTKRLGSALVARTILIIGFLLIVGCAGKPLKMPEKPVALDEAMPLFVESLTAQLKSSSFQLGGRDDMIVAQPFVDLNSGDVVAAGAEVTRLMIDQFAAMDTDYQLERMTYENYNQTAYLLTGSIKLAEFETGLQAKSHFHRLEAVIVDRKDDNKVVAKESIWVAAPEWALNPEKWYKRRIDGPTHMNKDERVTALEETLKAEVGQQASTQHMASVESGVEALLSDGEEALGDGDFRLAAERFGAAAEKPEGQTMKTFNGLYRAYMGAGMTDLAKQAFRHLLEIGGARNNLSIRFLFEVDSTEFKKSMREDYALWLPILGEYLEKREDCLEILGHCSLTGDPEYNRKLSERRANAIKRSLRKYYAKTDENIRPVGKGFDEVIVGTGTDDELDSIDRRVEFKTVSCE